MWVAMMSFIQWDEEQTPALDINNFRHDGMISHKQLF